MPLEDLDLEFEDEDELKKKKAEAVHVDLDLEFGAAPEKPAPAVTSPQPEKVAAVAAQPVQAKTPAPAAAPEAKAEEVQPGSASVKKLDDVRAKMAQAKAQVAKTAGNTQPAVSGANALQLAPAGEDMNLAQLVQLVEDTKFEASVQVAVAQEKSVFMAEMLSDAKLLQHQVQQLIVRMNTKHPDLKPELMAVQKALADFLAKKRK
ncbi:MAG: hypothetical protein ACLGG0_01265 [Bacteriovoracia bacterium]